MNKYIRAAVASEQGPSFVAGESDAWLFGKRPALCEYMTSLEGAGGEVREPSVIMVCCGEDGIRVGLKDDGAGGWLWKTAEGLAKGLDAIEKDLAAGTAKFRGPRAQRPRKGR